MKIKAVLIAAAITLSCTSALVAGLRTGAAPPQRSASTRDTSPNQILLAAAASYITLGNSPTLDGELAPYAERVDYYDQGIKTRNEIRKDIAAQRRQWPSRHFAFLRISDLRYDPTTDVGTVIVHYTYAVSNASKRKSGEAASLVAFRSVTKEPEVVLVKERKAK